jgi:hypothetical protein
LLDLPVALKLFASALARRHEWRGRIYLRRAGGGFEPVNDYQASARKPLD